MQKYSIKLHHDIITTLPDTYCNSLIQSGTCCIITVNIDIKHKYPICIYKYKTNSNCQILRSVFAFLLSVDIV